MRACLLDPGAPHLASAPTLVAEALSDLRGMSAYTKRLGVLPDSFVHIISYALSCTPPSPQRIPPSLQYLNSLMPQIRQELWDASMLCIRTAFYARSWLLRGASEVAVVEEALAAQRLYEGRRAGSANRRGRDCLPAPPPTRVSSRPRKRPRLPGFSVAWMGEYVDVPAEVSRRPRDRLSPAHLPALCRLI